ncbi:PAS-domain containing protein [Acidovorax lacteus]
MNSSPDVFARPDDPELELLRSMAAMLDGLDVALCVFDTEDRTLAWNRTFLRLFPEHEGHVHVGEPYADNLRRFYAGRLTAQERPQMDRYIAAGLERHRSQGQPFIFEHLGQRIQVSSLPLARLGRVRLWRVLSGPPDAPWPDATPAAGPSMEWLDQVPDGLMVCGADGVIQWCNESFLTLYGFDSRCVVRGLTLEAVYRLAWQQCGQAHDPVFREGLGTLAENMRFAGAPFELPMPRHRCFRVIARPGAQGSVFYAHVDISELKRQQRLLAEAEAAARESERQLRHKSALLEATLENMDQGVTLVNAEGVVELCNGRVSELLDLPAEVLANRPRLADMIAYQRQRGEFSDVSPEVQRYLSSPEQLQIPKVYERRLRSGRLIEVRSIAVRDGSMLRTYTDITERRHQEENIRYLASHDVLTGLLNRAMFMDRLVSEVAMARRTGIGCAVLYLDLDGFKPINDRHGHAVGDRALVWAAQRLRDVVRESDVVARLGGDEFVVLQRGLRPEDSTPALVRRLREAFGQPCHLGDLVVTLGFSVGTAACPGDAMDAEALLSQADRAMYADKARRRAGA